jgi:uncharacterized beta-barrel protein YwiB (DUF1934 family)
MMMDKGTVRLRLTSRIDGQTIEQTMQAGWNRVGCDIYLRYEEPDEAMGRTRTLVKWSPAGGEAGHGGTLRVVRHGDFESEQTFRIGERLPGRYKTPYGLMTLEADTTRLEADLRDGWGRLSWSYTLYVDEERTGEYDLTIRVEPVT